MISDPQIILDVVPGEVRRSGTGRSSDMTFAVAELAKVKR
jgi:hypothetical protein